jgi:hypothetical protein
MTDKIGQFLFLAAGAVGLFAFLSAAAWAGTQFAYRKARDRYALLRALAEMPGENAARVLEMVRSEEEQDRRRRQEEERRGYLIGGLACTAVGVALMIMLAALAKENTWTVGLVPFSIGVVLLPFGLKRRSAS